MNEHDALAFDARIADHERRIRDLETTIHELQSGRHLITAYAYSNLDRALATTLLFDIISEAQDPPRTLQQYYGSIREHLRTAEFPPGDPYAEEIRQTALALARRFFQDVESQLLVSRTISEKKLIL